MQRSYKFQKEGMPRPRPAHLPPLVRDVIGRGKMHVYTDVDHVNRHIAWLHQRITELERQASDASWITNPDRMGS